MDADAQIIVAHRLTDNGSDQDALLALLDAVDENTSEMPDEVFADNGFSPEVNLEGLVFRAVRGYVAAGRASNPPRARKAASWSRPHAQKYIVGSVFGHIKQARSFQQFLLRNIDKVRGEWAMICTARSLAKFNA